MTGSLGYAERLSWRDDLGGQLGDPELSEADADLERKVDALADLVADAKAKGGAVVHTGAGISTSAGIPDFRGPNGIWTLQKAGKAMPAASCRFDRARPSFTHAALVALQREGYVRYLVSCNVDCLHVRSGYPREEMAELHGNCFAERCELCETEYVRDFEMPSVGFKTTGRRCVARGCDDGSGAGRGGRLRDQVLDWEDPLPPKELKRAERESKEAALALVLGSSLQITPSCDLPLKTTRKRRDGSEAGKLAIVNLQKTPKDRHATLVVHAKVDRVMWGLTRRLGVAVPDHARRDALIVSHETGNASGSGGVEFRIRVDSAHGRGCPVPWLASARVEFHVVDEDGRREPAKIKTCEGVGEGRRGFRWKRRWNPPPTTNSRLVATATFGFAEGCLNATETVTYDQFGRLEGRGGSEKYEFETLRVRYDGPESVVVNDKPKREVKEEAKAEGGG